MVPQHDLLMSLMKNNGQTMQDLAGRLLDRCEER